MNKPREEVLVLMEKIKKGNDGFVDAIYYQDNEECRLF